jgi:UDP-glucose 4-epimerase
MNLKGKKILVAGGTGFIGRSVLKLLTEEGVEIVCLTREERSVSGNVHYVHADLSSMEETEGKEIARMIGPVDAAMYLAAHIPPHGQLLTESLSSATESTLLPFVHFLEYFGELFPRVIFASSIDVHGKNPADNFDENAPVVPQTAYAVAKACSEIYLSHFSLKYKKSYAILRLAQVYGPHEPEVRVTSLIVKAAINGTTFKLKNKGRDKRRYLFVDDAAQGLIDALAKEKEGTYILSGSEDIAITDIIEQVEKNTHMKLVVEEDDDEGTQTHILPSSRKAREAFGFSPKVSFSEGMNRVINTHHG